MNPALFDEREADKAIIASLVKTNHLLWHELESTRSMVKSEQILTKRSYPMSKVLLNKDGVLFLAHKAEELSLEEAQKLAASLEEDLHQVKGFIDRCLAQSDAAPAEQLPAQ